MVCNVRFTECYIHYSSIFYKVNAVSEAVLRILLPYINDIKEDLSCVKNDLAQLNLTELDNKLDQNLKNSLGYIYPVYTCGGTGGWRRVVYMDMTDPNTNCPSGWQLTSHSKRTCGRVSTGLTCDNTTFPVSGGDYTRVCGRIKGYQYQWTDAFEAYDDGVVTTIDGAYVSGVSLTHGSPRQHIWTFAAGISQGRPTADDACPCDATIYIAIPPFVGGDYFCEAGYAGVGGGFFPDDPL